MRKGPRSRQRPRPRTRYAEPERGVTTQPAGDGGPFLFQRDIFADALNLAASMGKLFLKREFQLGIRNRQLLMQ